MSGAGTQSAIDSRTCSPNAWLPPADLEALRFCGVGETGGVHGNGIFVSAYAIRHPQAYGLRVTGSQGSERRIVTYLFELALLDAEGEPVDEDGCNCDADVDDEGRTVYSPCNNPTCVMARESDPWSLRG